MAHRIEQKDGLIEVHLWGEGHLWEVLAVLRKLHQMAPRKEINDLWFLAEEYVVPWAAFGTIVSVLKRLISRETLPTRSAIVVVNRLQMIQAQMYQQQAAGLPYETGVFLSRDEAVRWLKEQPAGLNPERAVP